MPDERKCADDTLIFARIGKAVDASPHVGSRIKDKVKCTPLA